MLTCKLKYDTIGKMGTSKYTDGKYRNVWTRRGSGKGNGMGKGKGKERKGGCWMSK